MADLDALKNLGNEPIPGENPAGASVQYDDDFEEMRTEVQKLDSVSGEAVEWSMVADTCTDILQKRSKHLLVAVYLAMALYQQSAYAGLATGLTILRDLMTEFWETMEPPLKRKRGRIEGFVWLNERLGKMITGNKPSSGDRESLASCMTIIEELLAVLKDKLGEDAPGLSDINREITVHIKDLEQAVKAAETRKAQADKVAAGEVDGQTTPEDARKIYQQLRGKIKQVCDILRRGSPADPVPYRLLRAATWGPLVIAPPDTKGVTQVPPPAPEQVGRLAELQTKADWGMLIEAAESVFDSAPLWLDVHRFVLNAFEELGASYDAATEAVEAEVAILVHRLPDLSSLEFAGGMAFASTETRKWIEKQLRSGSGGGSGGGGATNGLPAGLEDATQEARRLAGKGKLSDAVQKMQDGIASTGDHRARFLWRLELARLCLDSGRIILAVPLLDDLESLIDKHDLEAWEPDLCKRVYMSLLTARRLLLKDTRKATPELVQKTNQLQDRLSRLDPMALLSME